jgi:hypothetical protein
MTYVNNVALANIASSLRNIDTTLTEIAEALETIANAIKPDDKRADLGPT